MSGLEAHICFFMPFFRRMVFVRYCLIADILRNVMMSRLRVIRRIAYLRLYFGETLVLCCVHGRRSLNLF